MKLPSYKWIILFAVLLTICYLNNRYEIFALNIPEGQGNEKAEGCFRVMTYNVNGPAGDEYGMVKKGIIEEIKKLEPDILCFQELSLQAYKEMQVALDSIFIYSDSLTTKLESPIFSLYSKKPIRNFKRYKCVTEIDTAGFNHNLLGEISILKFHLPFYSAEIQVDPGRWIMVFVCHLRSSAYSVARRSMGEDSSWSDGISLYLDNYKTGKRIRDWEADNLRLSLDSLEALGTPIIIAGDFNDWSGSYCMNTIRDGMYKDSWWEGGFGLGITYDEWHLKLRLDHIIYSGHFELDNVFLEKSSFSDHYPLISDFSYINK